jgi:hypothetical protein
MSSSSTTLPAPDLGGAHIRASAISSALAAGKPALALRLHFNYEADLAGGERHRFASEINPTLHIFAAQGAGILDPASDDDGVTVVDTAALASQLPKAAAASATRSAALVGSDDDDDEEVADSGRELRQRLPSGPPIA